jgi:hypothetical protein
MILPQRTGTKNARPAMRAEYGPHIKAVVGFVPPDWVLDKGMYRTLVFLVNLADYLMSDTYAERAAKRAERKARSMMKRSEK